MAKDCGCAHLQFGFIGRNEIWDDSWLGYAEWTRLNHTILMVTQSVWMTQLESTAFDSSRHIANHMKSSNPLSAGNLCHGRRLSSKISFHSGQTSKCFTETACLIQSNIVYLLLILSNFHYMNLVSYFDDINRLRSDPSDTKTFVWFILQEGTLAFCKGTGGVPLWWF